MKRKKFPTFAVIVLVFSLAWLFNDLRLLNINIPWIPTIISIISIGWIVNRYSS
ncbi:MAG TPA: hypothetical protein VJ912_00040 [Candidatus Nanoarchaeia archaeon]|nr:hypothetical protein [Candidatus Nanoarchaeia archaeon]